MMSIPLRRRHRDSILLQIHFLNKKRTEYPKWYTKHVSTPLDIM